jgi:type IV pilus assembly protein PilQ
VEAGNVLRVSTAARLKAEDDERSRLLEARTRLEAETRKRIIEAQRDEADFEATKARGPIKEVTIRLSYADAEEVAKTLLGILGLPPEGAAAPAPPLPGIYSPPAPTVIGSGPAPPTTLPVAAPIASPDSLGKGLTLRAHKPTNSIFLRYYANDVDRIVRLVKEQLDLQQPQVQISAQMVITSKTALDQIGIQWGGSVGPKQVGNSVVVGSGFTTTQTPPESSSVLPPPNPAGNLVNLPISALATASNPALGLLFGIIGKDFNINLAIQALETQGKARQVAAPNVVTVQNLEAVISRGFEVPFVSQSGFGGTNVQFKDALLELRVTPNVIVEDGITKIRMKLEINNNEPDFSRAVLGNPPLFKRRGKTEVVLREGERVVIGGIVNEDAAQQIRTVPVLGRVPVLGWLFKSREVNQNVNDMIIIVTPAVVTMGGPTAAR